MKAAFEAMQLEKEYKEKLSVISSHITVNELNNKYFDNDSVRKAFTLLIGSDMGLTVSDCKYVKSQANYKDVEINLHVTKDKLNSSAMKSVLAAISTKAIYNS